MAVVTRRRGSDWATWITSPPRVASRHPRRTAVVAGFLILGLPWAWWMTQLWGLPDVGDPFDIAAFEAHRVSDDRNAFVEYSQAASLVKGARAGLSQKEAASTFDDWSQASQPYRDYLARARPALDLWRAGTEKPDAQYHHFDGISFKTILPVSQELRVLVSLANLEGSRLESAGNMAGAWGWYRAGLRCSRHSGRHGFLIERMIGAALHNIVVKSLTRWAADPRVGAPLLRQALAEVIVIDALTAPRADAIKIEYLIFVHSRYDPDLYADLLSGGQPTDPQDWGESLPVPPAVKKPIQAARLLAGQDYERSLRVIRLMLANWLPQLERPLSRRVPLAFTDPPIYAPDPTAPPSARALSPRALARWHDSTLLARPFLLFLTRYAVPIERERVRQAKLVVHLADQIYRREHGGPPPSPTALVGPILPSLPEGYDTPVDPLGPKP